MDDYDGKLKCELRIGASPLDTKLLLGGEDFVAKLPIKRIAFEVRGGEPLVPATLTIECAAYPHVTFFEPAAVIAALRKEADRIERLMLDEDKHT